MLRRVPGGSWGDVTRDGRIVALVGRDGVWELQLLEGEGRDRVLTRCPDRLMFVRADTGPGGRLAATGQGHRDGQWWVWVEGGTWWSAGQVGGAQCVEVVGTSREWLVYGQTSATSYRVLTLDGRGAIGTAFSASMPATSQGFADASRQGYLWRDPVLRVGDTMQPHPCGVMLVGQHKDDPPRCVLSHSNGTPARVLYAGLCESPRAAVVDDDVVVYALGAYEGVIVRGRPEDFPAVTVPPVAPLPPQDPPVRPEPPMASVLETLRDLRTNYGASMTDDQCVELCNAVAYVHQDAPEQWGLSYKATGTRGVRYDGTPCCHDVLVRKDTGEEYDVLLAAGGASTPTWGKTGGKARPGREWVAPIPPQGVHPVPSPTPTPPPSPTPAPTCQFVPPPDLLPRLNVLVAHLEALRARLEVTDARVEALRDRVEAINSELHTMVAGQVAGLLEAIAALRR